MFEKFKERLKNIAKFVFAANTSELPAELSAPASYQKRSKFKNLDEFCTFVNDENNFNRESTDKESIATATAQFIADHMDDIVELLSFEPLDYNLQGKLAPAMEKIANDKDSVGLNVEKIKTVNVTKQEATYFLSERQLEEIERVKNFTLLKMQLEKWNELVEKIETSTESVTTCNKNVENIKEINKNIKTQIKYCDAKLEELKETDLLDSYTIWKIENIGEIDCLAEQTRFIEAIKGFMEKYTLLEEADENNYNFCKNGINDFSAHTLLEAIATSDKFISINIDAMSEINKATDFESLHKVHLFMTKAQVKLLTREYKKEHPDKSFSELPHGEQLKLYDKMLENSNSRDNFYIDHFITKYIVDHVADFKQELDIIAFKNTKAQLENMLLNNTIELDSERDNADKNKTQYAKLISKISKSRADIHDLYENVKFSTEYYDIEPSNISSLTQNITKLTSCDLNQNVDEKTDKLPTADIDIYTQFVSETYKTKVTDVLEKFRQELENYPASSDIKNSINKLSEHINPYDICNLASRIDNHNKIVANFITAINKNLDNTTEALPEDL